MLLSLEALYFLLFIGFGVKDCMFCAVTPGELYSDFCYTTHEGNDNKQTLASVLLSVFPFMTSTLQFY